MRLLADHPNMVQLKQVLQDSTSFYLVMEHCNGGELFDQIIRSGHMTEAMAANKAQQLISFLAHAHSKHVIHRCEKHLHHSAALLQVTANTTNAISHRQPACGAPGMQVRHFVISASTFTPCHTPTQCLLI